MGSYWECVTTLVCDIVETCSVLVKNYLICFENTQDSDLSSNEIAFQNLIHEINDDLVVHKKVFRMTQLLEKYKAYLPAYTGTYSSAKLQDRLVKHYAGFIVLLRLE
jgi:predicted DNA-binding protein YlxM (UPF0122 family)